MSDPSRAIATVIDLDAERRKRQPLAAVAPRPVVFVPMFAVILWVPVWR